MLTRASRMISSIDYIVCAAALALAVVSVRSEPARAQPADQAVGVVVAGDNRLGLELYRRLAAKPGNIVVSPHSVATAMAMAFAGARGGTEKEMAAVLHIGLPADAQADAYRRLNAGLNVKAAEDGPQLQVANALHLTRHGDLIAPAFRRLMHERFGAELFEGSDLVKINSWVKQKTKGRIERILTRLDPNSVCVLLNAVYFKGAWEQPFDKSATRPEPFHLATGAVVDVPTMHKLGYFQLLHARSYDAIRLRYYKSSLAMIVIVAAAGNSVTDLQAGLNTQFIAAIFSGLAGERSQKVDLSLPSFKSEFGADLIPPFQALGMKLAFDRDRADFSGMTGSSEESKRLHISQVQHRAFIDVNETGTEAAAATAVEIAKRAAPGKPAVFKVDRPFLYLIADASSGAILFIGRVMDPRAAPAK
jgi:serine protease inhibitor